MRIKSTPNILALAAALLASSISSHAVTLFSEAFGGGAGDINGTSADTFDSAITTAGGSATWVARNNFNENGSVQANQNAAAYLTLGSYINDAKGTAAGLFELTATLAPTAGSGDTVIALAGKYDLKIILCSTTATPPAWMPTLSLAEE